MRILKLFFITFLSATLIAGCSDGNIFDDFTDSDNVDLYIAYEKIDKGMNYEQVKTIVGSDYNDGKTEFSNEIQLRPNTWGKHQVLLMPRNLKKSPRHVGFFTSV